MARVVGESVGRLRSITRSIGIGADAPAAVQCRADVGSRSSNPSVAAVTVGYSTTGNAVPLRWDEMTTILVMTEKTLPLSEIKKRLSEIVDGVEEQHDRVVLTRNGRPAAVILSLDDLEALEETLDILSNPAVMRDIRNAESELDGGERLTADDLRAKYLHR